MSNPLTTVEVLDDVFKIQFDDGVGGYLDENSEIVRWTPKSEDTFGHKTWEIVFQIEAVRGSTKFEVASAQASSPGFTKMELTTSEDHAIVRVSCKAARAAASDEYAIADALEVSVSSSMQEMTLSMDALITGNGGGSRGEIAVGGITGDTIQLADIGLISLLARGMRIELADDDGVSGNAGTHGPVLEIEATNVETGEVIFTTDVLTTDPSAADGNFLFREGDYDGQEQRVLQGWFAWCPDEAPELGSDSFFGCDRGVHPTFLGGTRYNGQQQNKWDTVINAVALNRRNKGRGNVIWCDPIAYAELDQYLQTKQYFGQENEPTVGFRGFKAATPSGPVSFMQSASLKQGKAFLTRRESWLLKSLGKIPHVVDDDGQTWHLREQSDSLELRHRWFMQLGMTHDGPKDNTNITW